jgi:hypothetical protein
VFRLDFFCVAQNRHPCLKHESMELLSEQTSFFEPRENMEPSAPRLIPRHTTCKIQTLSPKTSKAPPAATDLLPESAIRLFVLRHNATTYDLPPQSRYSILAGAVHNQSKGPCAGTFLVCAFCTSKRLVHLYFKEPLQEPSLAPQGMAS